MAISSKTKEFLDGEGVQYEALQHATAYTAQEVAGAQHVSGQETIKAVIVKVDGKFVMCVLPAIHLLDLERFKHITGGQKVELASEEELGTLFPDYELGAEPPFGPLYGLEIFSDRDLESNEYVVFNGGTHTDTVRMTYADWKRLAQPTVAEFGVHI